MPSGIMGPLEMPSPLNKVEKDHPTEIDKKDVGYVLILFF